MKPTSRHLPTFLAGLVAGVAVTMASAHLQQAKRVTAVIGATTEVTEVSSGLAFRARVDTGAGVTSLDCPTDAISFADPTAEPADRVGQAARLRLTGKEGRTATVETRIAGYSAVRTADSSERRYQASLRLRAHGVERDVVVTLNDRSSMAYEILLGRDFLRDAFLVDVAIDNPEPR